jgi:AAA domain
MPEELLRAFSKRSDQVDLEVERLEASGRERTPRLVKWAVQATHKPKQHERPETLYERWRTEATERDVDPNTLVRQLTGRVREQDLVVSDWTVAAVFDRLAGRDGLTAQASTFARQDVIAALGGQLAGATRTQLEELADRFLAERAVAVVADRTPEERRWSTPDLLAVEERLVATAVDRAGEHTAVVSHEVVRAALTAHPTAGADQAAMVRDLCQGGAGVAPVVGRAGTGKTFALGVARHAWQLDDYQLLAWAPTGIATVSLEAEGFEEVATVDRLLLDLDRDRPGTTAPAAATSRKPDIAGGSLLDARTVLAVDEAGMAGSRKLVRLLDHAQRAGAKVVLVGDDRQLAAIDAGGGFRGLRLRLGASELTENRRQRHAWECEALELVRSGLVDEAVAAYREHNRVVVAESKTQATLALLEDWWAAWQDGERDPLQDVVVPALTRSDEQTLAIDTPSTLDLRRLSTWELRAERDRLRAELEQAPRDRSRELARATTRRTDAEQTLSELTREREADQQPRPADMLRLLRRGQQPAAATRDATVKPATQQLNRATDLERELRQHQQRRAGRLEANAHLGPAWRQVTRQLAWQRRAAGVALEQDQPEYVRDALGPVPESTRGRRAWRQAAAIQDYRGADGITDPQRALGPEPHEQAQRAAWRRARTAVGRVHIKQRSSDRTRDQQPTAPQRPPIDHRQPDPASTRSIRARGLSGPERAAG